jgi:glycosyltransferase involved in cell wall biosynthesis
MHILFINKASLRHEGGAEIRTKEVGKRLVLSGHEVVVLAAKTNINEPPFELYEGMQLHHKKVLPDWLIRRFPAPQYLSLAAANLFMMFHIYFFLQKEKFDLIRDDISPFPTSGLLALVTLPAAKRIAVIHNLPGTLRGWFRFYGPFYGMAGYIMARLLRSGKLKYDRLICVGKWFADELKRSPKIMNKIDYIPNGVDLEQFSNNRRNTEGDMNPNRLLSVGRLVETKGHRYLIKAISLLRTEFLDVRVDLLGDGPLRSSLTQLIRRLGLQDMVRFRSPVRHEDMPKVYRQYDLLVMPSVFEGFPVSLIEAMASKLPIVATSIPGIAGIVDDRSAILAVSQNVPDLAEKIRWALEHKIETREKAKRAYHIAENYDWDIIATKEIQNP